MSERRVVIVGAGMGGLCSAIVLAHQQPLAPRHLCYSCFSPQQVCQLV